jgi:crotonobetainyl-CoA:carnitine CoA-transferase CaiB-like acyl-CoA transferase
VLSNYRIVDLTDPRAWLCGLVLAQLGAEVVTVEPPGGHDCSGLRPAWREAYLRGRILIEGGPAEITDLVASADAVIGTGNAGIDLAVARQANPGLVTMSLTPWGETGPKARWRASDLVLAAAGGHVMLNGDHDRPPVRVSEPQAFHHAATEGVVHLVAALIERQRSGRGQHLDVAAHQCMLQASQSQMLAAAIGAEPPNRYGGGVRLAGYRIRLVYPALDGHVAVTFLFGDMIGRYTQRLMSWVHTEGHCTDEIRDLDYIHFFELMYGGELDPSLMDQASDAIARLTSTRTKAELLEEAMARDLLIAPIATTADTLAFDQLEARRFWQEAAVPGGPTVRHPGSWAAATGTPLRALGATGRPGADKHRRSELRQRRRPSLPTPGPTVADPPSDERPLVGIKVLDFSWVLAGPLATRLLADLGATVVRIESERRPDVIRAAGPFLPGEDGGDATALWHNTSAGKYSLELDIGSEAGREVVLDLARWADLAYESFSAGALDRLGLGYDALSAVNPRLVMVSTSLLGQTGPRSRFAGFGNLAAALAGFFEITGWPDRPPAGPFTAYTDYVSPRFAAAAMVAAVEHARRTGTGQYLDVSQAEAASHLLAPALLAEQLHAVTAGRMGNRDPVLTPHGVFPAGAEGEDRWLAIACHDDSWPALVDLAGLDPSWKAWDNARRRSQEERIESAVGAWTAGRDPDELTERLQAAGVAAHTVQHSAQIVTDPQLVHRGTPVQVPHPRYGQVWVENTQARWSRTQPGPAFAGPPVGHHTQEVLEGILGYDSERIADLVIAGAIG